MAVDRTMRVRVTGRVQGVWFRGWTKDEAIDMGAMGRYQLFAAGGAAIGALTAK